MLRTHDGGSLALLTDLYQLTMAYAHWRAADPEREAVFNLFFRQAPFGQEFALACGMADVRDYLADFHFAPDDIDYLRTLRDARGGRLFDPAFLDYLATLRFTGDVDAVPEGTAVFPREPMLRVRAPILQAQLLETALLNLVNFPTLIATKAARMAGAAGGDPVLDFGLRKAHGPQAGVIAARSAYIGGCAGTANVLAGKLYDIPVRGTHAHSWVMAFDDELEAFLRYAEALPDNCIFLVDTYDTRTGIDNAIAAGRELRERGHEMLGIRLDSGDLGELAREAREKLDAAGFPDARIAASSSLDEYRIAELKRGGAPIVLWGVGTRLTTGAPDGALDGVYKLGAIRDDAGRWRQCAKRSDTAEKQTLAGSLQVRRFLDVDGRPLADWLYDDAVSGADFRAGRLLTNGEARGLPSAAATRDLLQPLIRAGRPAGGPPDLQAIREHAASECSAFAAVTGYEVALEARLADAQGDT